MDQSRLSRRSFVAFVILLGMAPPLATDIYLSALPEMVREFSTAPDILNITMYGFMMTMAVSILVIGPLSDKYGRMPVLRFCLAEFMAMTILSALASDVWLFICLRILQAIGAGGAVTISMAFVKDSFRGKERADLLKTISVVNVLAPVMAPVMGTAIMAFCPWRFTLAIPVVLGLVCFVTAFRVDETLPEEERVDDGLVRTMHAIRRICSDRKFSAFLVMSALPYLAFMAHISVSSYIYEGIFGLDGNAYTAVLAATLIAGTAAMMVITRTAADLPNRRLLPLFPALLGISALLMAAAGHREWYLFFVQFFFTIQTSATLRPVSTTVLMASHDGDSGSVSQVINFMFFFFGCLGMVISTMSFWPDFITAMNVLILAALLQYCCLWAYVRGGRPLKGLEIPVSGEERRIIRRNKRRTP